MRRRSVIPIEAHAPPRRTGGLNVLAKRLEADDVPGYLVDVIVALREAAEGHDKRITQIERLLARYALRDETERAR
jgi:hypothetical protein